MRLDGPSNAPNERFSAVNHMNIALLNDFSPHHPLPKETRTAESRLLQDTAAQQPQPEQWPAERGAASRAAAVGARHGGEGSSAGAPAGRPTADKQPTF